MTKEELGEAISQLNNKYAKALVELDKLYIVANNPYKKGDVVTDHIGSIRIGSISYNIANLDSCAVYRGIWLKKDGMENKKREERVVYQLNLL
jgi:hypothetical protein